MDYGTQPSDFAGAAGPFRELGAFINLPAGFLTDPEQQLFVSNDFAAMLRSVLLTWCRLDREQDGC
jgi:hypothetical protein